ncbi:MAG TPA: thiamine phosphate synthase [Puia sp.]
MNDFLLAVLTLPGTFSGEADQLEGLLDSGLTKLHVRKPEGVAEGLLDRLAPRWSAQLVLHGSRGLAERYGIAQVHGGRHLWDGRGAVSTSVHSWVELATLPAGLEYAFISPLFDSISKPGYRANSDLLERVKGTWPCLPVGLGGISAANIGEMLRTGWKGAAVLGWIWGEPDKAVSRFKELKKIIDEY